MDLDRAANAAIGRRQGRLGGERERCDCAIGDTGLLTLGAVVIGGLPVFRISEASRPEDNPG